MAFRFIYYLRNIFFITSTVSNVNVIECQNSSFLLMGSFASKLVRPSKMASSPEIQQFIKEAVSQEKVVVFSKSYCPYCKLAKEVFQQVKQPIKVYELDERNDGADIQNNLAEITGFRTVPQVFINGNCVGGGSDVKSLYESGKLQPMLIG